jgi:hypothetical protein
MKNLCAETALLWQGYAVLWIRDLVLFTPWIRDEFFPDLGSF